MRPSKFDNLCVTGLLWNYLFWGNFRTFHVPDDDDGKKKRLHAVLHLDCVPQKSKREKESQLRCGQWNIARSTTDPEIDSVTKFGNNVAPLALVATCKSGHKMAPLAFVANLTKWWHKLDWFKIWSCATSIVSKVGHQVGSHALPHCLELPYWH